MRLQRRGGVALDGGRVRTAALVGARDDAGVGAEGVGGAEVCGFAKFAGDAGGEHEADAGDAGEHGVGVVARVSAASVRSSEALRERHW